MIDGDDATMLVPLSQRLHNTFARSRGGGGGGRESAPPDTDQDMRDEPEEERREGAPPLTSARPWYDYLPTWNNNPSMLRTVSRVEGDLDVDYREEADDDDIIMEREGGDDDDRIHEPLKRQQQEQHDISPINYEPQQSNKRRRVMSASEMASSAFCNMVPALTERQQAMVEYIAPSCLTPLFKALGYTSFALTWVVVMYFCHFVQTAISTFGPETKAWCFKAWIPPLIHSLIDTYLWNHSMITLMLISPERFSEDPSSAYWLAVFFVMAQQLLYLVVSLKTDYGKHKHLIRDKRRRQEIETRFVDCFLWYALADVFFIVARLSGIRYILYIGLVEFNVMPLYLVGAYQKRRDEATAMAAPDAETIRKKATNVVSKKIQ